MSQMISRRSHSLQFHAQSEGPLGWVLALLLIIPRALAGAARRTWNAYADERLLRELSDHQLRDIGIRREHIPHRIRNNWDL